MLSWRAGAGHELCAVTVPTLNLFEAVCLIPLHVACFWEVEASLLITCHGLWRATTLISTDIVKCACVVKKTQGQCSNNESTFPFASSSCCYAFSVRTSVHSLNKPLQSFLTNTIPLLHQCFTTFRLLSYISVRIIYLFIAISWHIGYRLASTAILFKVSKRTKCTECGTN